MEPGDGYRFEVRVGDDRDLALTYDAIEWLYHTDHLLDVDYDINMHGAVAGYTSFYFKTEGLAVQFSLMFL